MKQSTLLWLNGVSGLFFATCHGANSTVPLRHVPNVSTRNIKQPVLPFVLVGADSKRHTLADFQGHSITIFFFCGCDWCTRCAKTWTQFQQGGALRSEQHVHSILAGTEDVNTLVVFAGDAFAAQSFAVQTGLRPEQTVMLCDTTMHITNAYHVEACPRVFVVDAKGRLCYTNNHQDDRPHTSTPLTIVCRALNAMHTAQASKNSK